MPPQEVEGLQLRWLLLSLGQSFMLLVAATPPCKSVRFFECSWSPGRRFCSRMILLSTLSLGKRSRQESLQGGQEALVCESLEVLLWLESTEPPIYEIDCQVTSLEFLEQARRASAETRHCIQSI